MAQVKGTILVDFIKTIKADKSGAYDQYLTDEDREIITQRILPSGWYPYETFKNCFNAAVQVLAKGDMNMVRQWGRLYGEAIITSVYKGLIKEGAPMDSLKKHGTYLQNIFDFGELIIDQVSDNEAVITIREIDREFEPLFHMMGGWIERSLELSGAKDIKIEAVSKAWAGDPETRMKLTWSA